MSIQIKWQFKSSLFSYIYTKTTGFQTSYKEKQYYSLRNHVSNLEYESIFGYLWQFKFTKNFKILLAFSEKQTMSPD